MKNFDPVRRELDRHLEREARADAFDDAVDEKVQDKLEGFLEPHLAHIEELENEILFLQSKVLDRGIDGFLIGLVCGAALILTIYFFLP